MEYNKKLLGTRVTTDCIKSLKYIGIRSGRQPAGVGTYILELFKEVDPENFEEVCAMIVKVGRGKVPR